MKWTFLQTFLNNHALCLCEYLTPYLFLRWTFLETLLNIHLWETIQYGQRWLLGCYSICISLVKLPKEDKTIKPSFSWREIRIMFSLRILVTIPWRKHPWSCKHIFFFQLCQVGGLMLVHNMNEPNLAIGQTK